MRDAGAAGVVGAAGDAALPAQPALPVQHAQLDLDAGAPEADRARQRDAQPAVLVPALHARQRADRARHGRAGGRDAEALSRDREDALRGPAAARSSTSIRPPSGRGCPRCCSSRWSRTRSNMRSPRRRKAPTSASTCGSPGNGCRSPYPTPARACTRHAISQAFQPASGSTNIRERLAQAYGAGPPVRHALDAGWRLLGRDRDPVPARRREKRVPHDHPHHPRRRRAARDPGARAPPAGARGRRDHRQMPERPRGDPLDQDAQARPRLSRHPDARVRRLLGRPGADGGRAAAVRLRHRLSATMRCARSRRRRSIT